VNNCIGARNLGWFFSFIFVTDLHLAISIAVDIMVILGISSGGIDIVPIVMPGYERLIAIIIGALSIFFFCPLTILVVIQSQNF
jgi:hypothetical protein